MNVPTGLPCGYQLWISLWISRHWPQFHCWGAYIQHLSFAVQKTHCLEVIYFNNYKWSIFTQILFTICLHWFISKHSKSAFYNYHIHKDSNRYNNNIHWHCPNICCCFFNLPNCKIACFFLLVMEVYIFLLVLLFS